MSNIDKSHYKELKRFLSYLNDLPKQDNQHNTTFIDNVPVTSYILTVSIDSDVGYIINNEKSKDVIKVLLIEKLITPIDDNMDSDMDSNTKKYLINDYGFLYDTIADSLQELEYD